MADPRKNSYNSGILCSNWIEDRAGARLAKTKPGDYAAAKFFTTHAHDSWQDFGPAKTAGPAPAPLDRLDGHLVMAHGTNICNRVPPGDHYLTVGQSFFKRLPESQVLKGPGSVPGNVGRVELIRKKALARAAGIDVHDIDVMKRSLNLALPMSAEPLAAPSLAGRAGAQTVAAERHFRSVAEASASDAAVAALVAAPRGGGAHFGRDGAFTKEFAGSRADYQSLMKSS
jgi:hypothetical protein